MFSLKRGNYLCVRRITTAHRIPSEIAAKPFKDIPKPKWSLPYFGTLFHYRSGVFSIDNRAETLKDLRRKHGPILKETLHGQLVVHLFNPEDYEKIYRNEGKSPEAIPLMKTIVDYRKQKGYNPGIGNINGDEWYKIRAAIRPLMGQPLSVKRFLGRQQEVTTDFVERIGRIKDKQTNVVHNLEFEIGKWNYETAGLLVFDKRLNSLETDENDVPAKILDINSRLFDRAIKFRFAFLPLHNYISTPLWKDLIKEEDYFHKHIMDLFLEAVEKCKQMESSDDVHEDDRFLFLRGLLKRKELSFLDAHIIGQSLFTDGISTTVPSIPGQLYCIAANSKKQEKLYQEVCEIVGASNECVTADHLGHMPYLRACVKESFRFFPTGLEVSRILKEDMILSGYHVPEGTAVELNNFAVSMDEKYFPRPEEYLPERWLRGSSDANDFPYAHTPFSHGPRQCLGRRFAEQEIFLLIIKLLQNFRLEWRCDKPLGQKWRLLNVPSFPPQIAFVPRSRNS